MYTEYIGNIYAFGKDWSMPRTGISGTTDYINSALQTAATKVVNVPNVPADKSLTIPLILSDNFYSINELWMVTTHCPAKTSKYCVQGIPLILRVMKKFLLFILCFCIYLSVSAQRVYFIYFESDKHPFYLKMDDKVYSSSEPGYLLLSNLKDSGYTFFIGFPSGQPKEAKFQVNIKGTDHGFAIRNTDGVINLFDLQKLNLVKPVEDQVATNIRYEARSDAFTSLLSKAAGDTSILLAPILVKTEMQPKEEKKDIVKQEPTEVKTEEVKPPTEVKTEEVKPKTDVAVTQTDKSRIQSDSIDITPVQSGTAKTGTKEEKVEEKEQKTAVAQRPVNLADSVVSAPSEEPYRKSIVKRHSESSTSEGFGLVFFDSNGEEIDTIRLLIPNPKIVIQQTDTTQNDNFFLEVKKDTAQQSPPVSPAKTAAKPPRFQCGKQATDNDFFRLRKSMAARETDEAMVDEAKKVFKSKCFTTEQIRNLSALFLTSAGKYQFFDAAFMHVSDPEQFASLQSDIKDDYYLRRFKALIGE
jgi:hypothetical protein